MRREITRLVTVRECDRKRARALFRHEPAAIERQRHAIGDVAKQRRQFLSPGRGDEPAAAADHQWVAEDFPQPTQRIADRRLGDVQARGRARRAPFLEHRVQHQEQVQVDRGEIHAHDVFYHEVSVV